MNPKILILDAGMLERDTAAVALRSAGLEVMEARTEREARALAEAPVVVVIGGHMADDESLRLMRRLRARGWHQPFLVRGNSDRVEACVAAFDAGADDFVARERDVRELVARVQGLLRNRPPALKARYRIGRIVFDLARMQAIADGKTVRLTSTELSMLALLVRGNGSPVARNTMLRTIWGHADGSESRTIETHIWRLRKKIGDSGDEPRWLLNHPGIGYSLVVEPVSGP